MRSQKGQGMMLAVMCLGVFMASMVWFGYDRSRNAAKTATKVDQGQAAYEALAEAAKRVQSMYANEAGCTPEQLNTRLSNLPNLPTPFTLGGSTMPYAVAQPDLAPPDKQNLCTATTGCRQMAVPMGGIAYVVTVGKLSADPGDGRFGDCPRDAHVKLTTAVNRNLYYQRVTLTNICSFASCGTTSNSANPVDFHSPFGGGFDASTLSNVTLTNSTGNYTTTVCTAPYHGITSRQYGSGFTEDVSLGAYLSIDDLKWARRYLETGGEDVGETNYLKTGAAGIAPGTNGACAVANSAGQCNVKACFPFFDLNRDGKNNEEDLAILENFIRGYLTTLPVNDGLQ